MKEIKYQNRKLLYPSIVEWNEIMDARITKYEDKAFLKNNLMKNFISKLANILVSLEQII